MNATRLNELDAWQAARALARRELRAQDLVRACLDRVAARDADVRAFVHLDPDAALAQDRALDAGPLRGPQTAGSIIRPAAFCGVVGYKPSPLPDLAGLQKAVMAFEMARALSHECVQHAGRLSARLRALSDEGLAIPGAQHALHLAQAPVGTDATGDPLYCRGWTLLGLPCLHLPFTTGRRGLPVGQQRVGRFAGDHRLLAVAQWVHERLTR